MPKKGCLPATNESTDNDSYLEEEPESNTSNDLLPVMQFETNLDRTKLLEKKVGNLEDKINFLEKMTSKWKIHVYITTKPSLEIKSILKKLQV